MADFAKLTWDEVGERLYETGVDQGVLYRLDSNNEYKNAYAWNGLTGVDDSPTGGESNKKYADNIAYLNLVSREEWEGTIKAYTYPDEFAECDGSKAIIAGMYAGQQTRKPFGFSYRTLIGNDTEGTDFGYAIHVVYGCQVEPSERSYETVNDDPDAIEFSWKVKSTAVKAEDLGIKTTSTLVFKSTELTEEQLAIVEDALYGSTMAAAWLPMPADWADLLDIDVEG